jgi:PAS domain S-box-containing protein
MKDRLVLFSVFICIYFVVFLLHPAVTLAAPRPQVIKIVMDNNYPPYVFLNSEGKLQGILVDQWKLWEQKTGIRTEISAMDWGEGLRRMKAGEFDVIDTIFKTEERVRWLDFTGAYDRLEGSAFFDKKISGISDAASLKGFVVAAKTGDAAVDVLKKNGIDRLLLFDSYEAIILAAKEHKVTVFVLDNPPAHYYLHKFGVHDHYRQSPPLYSGEFHRAVKKGNSELLKVVEDGFGLISSEELKRIENTWNGSPLAGRHVVRYFFITAGSLCLLVLVLFAWNRMLKRNVEKRTAELKTSEERASLILNSIAEGIFGVDLQGNCTFCNPAALRLLGYTRSEDVVGKKIHPLIHHTRPDGTRYHSKDCRISCSYREGKGINADDEMFWRSDGASFPVECWAQPIMRNGVPIGAVTAFTDITGRKQVEEALRANEERYRSLFNNMLEGFAYCRMLFEDNRPADFIYLDVNSAFGTLTGLQNVVGKKVSEVIPGIREADPGLFEVYGRVALNGNPERFEIYVESLSTWFAISVYSPQKEHFVAVFDVITERKKTEEALSTSERRFREVLENVSLIGVMLDTEGRILLCNDHLLSITGWKREEVLHRNWFEIFLPPDIRSEVEHSVFIKSIQAGQVPVHYENPINTRQGERRLIAWSNTVFRDKSGAVTGIASIGEDITERKRMEEALIRSETLLQTIIDTEPDCVKMIDAQGNLIMMNRAGLEMIEVDDFEQVRGQCICPMITSEHRQAFMDLTARVFEGQSGTLMFEMSGSRGRHLWLETRAVPFRNEKNEIIALLGITRDITERRKLEEQLRQSQKMESVGTLAGGVAHDFNNILTAITGYGHLTLMKMAPDDTNRMNIQHILESADRAAHLTRDLLLFSRKKTIDRKPVDLNEGIQKLGKFLTRVIGEDIVFKTTLSGGAIPVLADSYQIDQVLMNLATNARDAMPKGGAFTITTEQAWLNESFTSSHGLAMPGKYAVISVSDTGQGMNEETRQRVFEPFFTTKEVGKGTGLGLSVVYGIVQQHDGQVTVYSEPGQGTTFRIYLPVNQTGVSAGQAAALEEPPVGGTETILLAEDDRAVREMTLLLLQDFGYTVIIAVDGEDAVKKFSENKDRIQLLLFDLIMPGKSGKDAYDEIRLVRPDLKVIFASGYDPDMVRQKALLEQHVPVVYKPVPMAVLLKTIRAVLDKGGA